MKTVGVAIVGFGTVGTGVVRLLVEDAARLEQAAGCRLALRHVCDVDLKRPRAVRVPKELLTDDLERVLADKETSIAVETVGGTTVAVDILKRLLAAGKDVVTANKAALAERGAELFDAARKAGRSISFEASCAAGSPAMPRQITGGWFTSSVLTSSLFKKTVIPTRCAPMGLVMANHSPLELLNPFFTSAVISSGKCCGTGLP